MSAVLSLSGICLRENERKQNDSSTKEERCLTMLRNMFDNEAFPCKLRRNFLKCGDRKVLHFFYEVQSIRKNYGILRRLDGFREICPGGYLDCPLGAEKCFG